MAEPIPPPPEEQRKTEPTVVVKKYANRRLYNTESSSYITLDNLAEMIRLGRDFVVYDARTGDDITRGVLTQIIVEEEGKGRAMLPTGFLRQLIGLYGGNMENLVPRYLEQAMTAFGHQQQQVREAMQQTVGRIFPFGSIEEVGRQNLAMMERALSLWNPTFRAAEAEGDAASHASPTTQEVAALRAEVESLRRELADTRQAEPAPLPVNDASSGSLSPPAGAHPPAVASSTGTAEPGHSAGEPEAPNQSLHPASTQHGG